LYLFSTICGTGGTGFLAITFLSHISGHFSVWNIFQFR